MSISFIPGTKMLYYLFKLGEDPSREGLLDTPMRAAKVKRMPAKINADMSAQNEFSLLTCSLKVKKHANVI